MSGYKNFAVVGAVNIGKFIIDALLEKKAASVISSVIVLSRTSDGHKDLAAKGVKIVAVDYASPSSIQSALSGIDVVISTLAGPALGLQDGLASGAKAAGVQLFVPSEFGSPTEKDGEGPSDMAFQRGLAEAFGFDVPNGKITIGGSGTAAISWTSRSDISRYLAHVLTALPKEQLEWRVFRIEGDRVSFNQIVEVWKARSGKAVEITHRPRSDLEEALAKNPKDFMSYYLIELDKGSGVVGKQDELANGEFAEWEPRKVIDILVEIYGK